MNVQVANWSYLLAGVVICILRHKLVATVAITLSIIKLTLFLFCVTTPALAQAPGPARPPSIVYVVHDPDSISEYRTNQRVVHAMVDRLVMAVTGQPTVAKAWGSLVSPEDKIGIKISAAGGELFTTHHDVVNAIVDGLAAAGHAREKIIVWDRSLGGIKEAGYRPGADGYQLRAIPPHDGYDPRAQLSAPVLGKLVWGDFDYQRDTGKSLLLSDTVNTSDISHLSRILANDVTKIINVPVMSNSEANGIAGCLYNVTIPNIDNWRRFTEESAFGASSIAQIYADPRISSKVVLNLMDGLLAQFAGGPQSQPNYAEHHGTLYASKDPVAVDAVALQKLGEWRMRASVPPIVRTAAYVQIAAQMGLGNSEPNRIETRNVGR
jgi:uncharacterized protein (DUF362 family)